MIKYICNKCRKDTREWHYQIQVGKVVPSYNFADNGYETLSRLELCESCWEEIEKKL